MYNANLALDCTIYGSELSPCKQFLAVGNNYGFLSIFNLTELVKSNCNEGKPDLTFKAHEGEIFCLKTIGKYLISGGVGGLNVWTWKSLISGKPGKKSSLNNVQSTTAPYKTNEVNCLSAQNINFVAAGKDDDVIDIWDISAEKCVSTLKGHENYIHSVHVINETSTVSASEDGFVKIWDTRTSKVAQSIVPNDHKTLCRPENGKFVSAITSDSNGEWIVCGGGPKLSLWHARSLTLASAMSCDDFIPYVVDYYRDIIVAGGNKDCLYHYNVNGELKSKIPCSIGNIFTLAFDNTYASPITPIAAAGASFKIDIFNNLQYKSMSLWQV